MKRKIRLMKLKCQANYQRKSRAKKAKFLQEYQEIVNYECNNLRRPPSTLCYPGLTLHVTEPVCHI